MNMNMNKLAESDFLEYSLEVIKSRAIPSLEDGMKPIHRRIIYIMDNIGNTSKKPTKKCAKVVGEIMGRLHAHGDSSIYDALVRLAQPWKMRYPLIQIQGNMGNLLGDGAASSRYTECKLTPIGELMISDINKNTVPQTINYSGEEYEPDYLTSQFPNILVNPNLGIAVGMSSTTLPHNLKEVCDALMAAVDNSDITTEEIMQYIKGPDFPTGGVITNKEELLDIYRNGKGTIKLESKYEIEQVKNKTHIVIKEIPYLVSPVERIIDKIKKMIIEEEYSLIENVQNNTGKDGFEIRIVLSKGANINKVLEDLSNKTGFTSTISMNNNVLWEGSPIHCNYVVLCSNYLKHRHKTIIAASKFDKEKCEEKRIIILGLIKALEIIDKIISDIKTSESRQIAKEKLINNYSFLPVQADSILDMKLSKITKLEKNELIQKEIELTNQIKKLIEIIENHNNERNNLIKEQLLNIKNKFGDERKTAIVEKKKFVKNVKPKEVINLILDTNEIIPIEPTYENFNSFNNIPLGKKKIILAKRTNIINDSFVFTSCGKSTIINNATLSIGQSNILKTIFDGKIVNMIDNKNKKYFVFITKNGLIKKTAISEYDSKRTIQGIKLKPDDELLCVYAANNNDYLFALVDNNKIIKILVDDLSESSRVSLGVKIGQNKKIIDAQLLEADELLLTIADEKAKYTSAEDFVENARTSSGQQITEKTTKLSKRSKNNKLFAIIDNKKIKEITNTFAIKSKSSIGSKFANANSVILFE